MNFRRPAVRRNKDKKNAQSDTKHTNRVKKKVNYGRVHSENRQQEKEKAPSRPELNAVRT